MARLTGCRRALRVAARVAATKSPIRDDHSPFYWLDNLFSLPEDKPGRVRQGTLLQRFRNYLEEVAEEEGVVDYQCFRDTVARLPIEGPTSEDLKAIWPYLPNMLLDRFLIPDKPEYSELPDQELELNYQQVTAQIPSLMVDGVAQRAGYSRKYRILDLIYPTSRPYEIEMFTGGRTMECDYEAQAVEYARKHWPEQLSMTVDDVEDYVAFILASDFGIDSGEQIPIMLGSIHCALLHGFDDYTSSSQLVPRSQEFATVIRQMTNLDYIGHEFLLAHMQKSNPTGTNSSAYRVKELFVCGDCGGAINKDGCTYCDKRFSVSLKLKDFWRHWGAPLPPQLSDLVSSPLILTADQRTHREYTIMTDEVSEYVRLAMNNARKKALEEIRDMNLRTLVDHRVGHADTKVAEQHGPLGVRVGAGSRTRHVELRKQNPY